MKVHGNGLWLRNRYSKCVRRSAFDSGAVDAGHDIVVGLAALHRAVGKAGREIDSRIQQRVGGGAAEPLVVAFVARVSCPEATPTTVGMNTSSNDTDCPGLRVTGNVIPVSVYPVPLSVAELTVTAPVPVDVRVNVCLD